MTGANTASTDNAIVLAPVVTLPGDATLTVDTNVLSGGIADQLVQALVSSGDVVVPPLPAATVPAAVTTQVSKTKHAGKYAAFLQPKGPAPHPEADYLLIGLAGKNHRYACSVGGCGCVRTVATPSYGIFTPSTGTPASSVWPARK